jgi:hypothetical protein
MPMGMLQEEFPMRQVLLLALQKKVKGDKKELVFLSIDNVVIKMQGVCFKGKIIWKLGY